MRTVRAAVGNTRAWWRWRRLDDVLPPLRPVVTSVVAPAEMVRPVLRRPAPAVLALLVVAAIGYGLVGGGLALASSHGRRQATPALVGRSTPPDGTTGAAPDPSASASTGPSAPIDPTALPRCTSTCRTVRTLRVTVKGAPAYLMLVSTTSGRPSRALRFYLLSLVDRRVLWSGPDTPLPAYASKRLGGYSGSMLRQDATGHVYIDLLTSPTASFVGVLDLGDGTDVRDFGSLTPDASGEFRFSTDTPGADTVDVDGAKIYDVALLRAATSGKPAYYDLLRWNGTDYVPRGCARQSVDGGLGTIRPAGSCG